MTRPLDQPPYSTPCAACADGERWLHVSEGQELTGDEEVVYLCPEHAKIVEGKPGWRKAWNNPPLPGVPLETHELMTVVARRLEDVVTNTPIPELLRKQLANVFRDTARRVTLDSRMSGPVTGRDVDQQFSQLIRLAELAWELDMPPANETDAAAAKGDHPCG